MTWYLIIINILTVCMYGADKSAAIHRHRRIPNKVLLGLAAAGGSAGALLGMYIFRHKTQTWYYKYSVPVFLILHIVIIIFMYRRGLIWTN